jgi:UDP-N-acetyl-2-amino-2-deoxyglucuronate dehydrogenase
MKFALIGAAGYIAPRHMEAIKACGGELVASYDPSDSVGILDRWFPACEHFTEYERFDRFVESERIDFVSICSPNHLHEAHSRVALRAGADVICEKPLVVHPSQLDTLTALEKSTGKRVWAIQQMRLHNQIELARSKYEGKTASVSVEYVTPRGTWYESSWKWNGSKSGGIMLNIGVHLFDAIGSIFGKLVSIDKVAASDRRAFGDLHLERASVKFSLSLEAADVPTGKKSHRVIRIDGDEFDVSEGFTELHTKSYSEILAGRGYGIEDARPAIEMVEALRNHRERKAA